jgi:hypothetical protein
MPISAKVSGSWQTITKPATKVSGTWRPLGGVWTRVSGVWQRVYTAAAISNQFANASFTSGTVTATYELNSNGIAYLTDNVSYGDNLLHAISNEWQGGGTNSDFEARMTVNSGSLSAGTTGSWVALSSTQTWTLSRATAGISTASATLEIRLAGSATVLDSATIDFEAERA